MVCIILSTETGSNLRSVFTNVPYMLLVLSTVCAYYLVPGIMAQIAKYLVVQFKIDQAMTAIYTGRSIHKHSFKILFSQSYFDYFGFKIR